MSAVSSVDYSSFDSDFARAISRRFEHGRFLIVGANARKLQCQFAEFVPDYECHLIDLDPGAVFLRHAPGQVADGTVAAAEIAFARFNRQLGALRRTLEIRGSELEGAQRHIAGLKEKLLKLREYRRELKLLKEQKQRLRKSPKRRLGQIFLAPYRLPKKLAQTVWKNLGRKPGKPTSAAPTEYQKWFETTS
jgi:hypothetical protein